MNTCVICGRPLNANRVTVLGLHFGPTVHDDCLEKRNEEEAEKRRARTKKSTKKQKKDWHQSDE